MTQRKSMTERVRESEEKYRHIFENLNDAALLADAATGVIIDSNPQAAALLGRSREEIIGMHQTEIHPPEKAEQYRRMFLRHVELGHAVDYDGEVIGKDGTVVPVIISASTLTIDSHRFILGLFRNVTEHRLTEEALRKSEERYRTLFEQSRDAIYITTRDGRFIDANQSALDLLGYTREELLKLDAREAYANPADRKKFQQVIEKFGSVRHYEVRLRKKDGTEIDCLLTSFLRRDDDGDILGYHGIIRDVTEQKRAEKALRESEERFRRLSDAAFEGIVIHERGIVLDANQAYAGLFGYEPSEIIGKNCLEFVAPQYRDSVFEIITSGYEKPYEVECVRKDGTKFLAGICGRISHYQGREIRVAAARDITERKRIENKLRESEEKLRIIFDSVMEGIIVCDLQGRIVQLNNAAVLRHGFNNKEELLGRNISELMAKKDVAKARANLRKRLKNGLTRNAEYTFLRRYGTQFDAEVSTVLQRDESGNPTGFISVARDITDRKRLRENMQFYISQITKAQEEERKRLACELHDETVQALIVLSLDIEAIAKDKDRLPEETVRQLEQLREKTYGIMSEVRRFSHELRPGVLDKLGLVPALELLADELKERMVNTRFEVIGSERRLSPDTELVLFRIAQEALRNVWKHSQATEAAIVVSFAPNKVKLSVIDNGKGFELPEELCELAGEGKLGLIGMQERARLLDGSFVVESKLGKGTVVTVEVMV